MKKNFAKIKPEFQEGEIYWVVIEGDSEESGGVFLFLHKNIDTPCLYDEWHLSLQEAEKKALQTWGISEVDWEISD